MNTDKDHIVSAQLVENLKSGDSTAFREIFQLFEKRLYHFVFSFTKSNYLSEEIIQEVFIKIWEQREKLVLERSFDSYIYTITRNLTYNYLRDSSKRQSIRDELWLNISAQHQHVESDLIFAEYWEIVEGIVQDLPQQKRSIYQLSKQQGKSHSEIAELLGISQKTVKNHLWKTMAIIRSKLQPYMEDFMILMLISTMIY